MEQVGAGGDSRAQGGRTPANGAGAPAGDPDAPDGRFADPGWGPDSWPTFESTDAADREATLPRQRRRNRDLPREHEARLPRSRRPSAGPGSGTGTSKAGGGSVGESTGDDEYSGPDDGDGSGPPGVPASGRQWPRLWPVLVALALLIGVAVLVSPQLRNQMIASTSQQRPGFFEVYVRAVDKAAACQLDQNEVQVRFVLVNHFTTRQAIPYRVELSSASGKTVEHTDTLRAAPERANVIEVTLERPDAEPYDLTVNLPGRPERLSMHCAGATP